MARTEGYVVGLDIGTTKIACIVGRVDDDEGLHSIPRALGVRRAFLVSAVMHVCALTAFAASGALLGLGPMFRIGLVLGAGVLLTEHVLVRPGRYERMATSFFRLDAVFSLLLLVTGAMDVLRG